MPRHTYGQLHHQSADEELEEPEEHEEDKDDSDSDWDESDGCGLSGSSMDSLLRAILEK